MVAFNLFTDFAYFADIAYLVLDYLLQSRARNVFDSFLQLINGRRLLSAHMNHSIVTEEIINGIEAGAVWGHLTLALLLLMQSQSVVLRNSMTSAIALYGLLRHPSSCSNQLFICENPSLI